MTHFVSIRAQEALPAVTGEQRSIPMLIYHSVLKTGKCLHFAGLMWTSASKQGGKKNYKGLKHMVNYHFKFQLKKFLNHKLTF